MKLAIKLIVIQVLVVCGCLAIDARFAIHRERTLFKKESERNALLLGRVISGFIEETWNEKGERAATALLNRMTVQKAGFRFRSLSLKKTAAVSNEPRIALDKLDELKSGNAISFHQDVEPNKEELVTYVPLSIDNGFQYALELTEDMEQMREYTSNTVVKTIVLAVGMMLLGSIAIGTTVMRIIGHPLQELSTLAECVAKDDYSQRFSLEGRGELSILAESFNSMCEHLEANRLARIEALEQLRHADRLKTVGTLASSVAHELGTPINIISARAGIVLDGPANEEELTEHISIIHGQCHRMTTIIRNLLNYSRRQASEFQPVNLGQIIDETVILLQPLIKRKDGTLIVKKNDLGGIVVGVSDELRQVLSNLVINAIHAIPQGGKVEIKLYGKDGSTVLEVADNGVGIDDEDQKKIFEPFFTTKSVGEGSGLGLAIARDIVSEHDGELRVESKKNEGSRFFVTLPLEDNERFNTDS